MTAHMKIKTEAFIIMKSYFQLADPTSCDILSQSVRERQVGGTHTLLSATLISFPFLFLKNLCPLNAQKQRQRC